MKRKIIFILFLIVCYFAYQYKHELKLKIRDLRGFNQSIYSGLKDHNFIDLKISEPVQKEINEVIKMYGSVNSPYKRKWYEVEFKINGEYIPAKIKLHGTSTVHRSGGIYSYSIKLNKKSKYLNNSRRFKLIKHPECRTIILAPNKLAKKRGLISPSGEMKILRINDKEIGAYGFVEDIRKDFLEKEFGMTNYCRISQVADLSRKLVRKDAVSHMSSQDLFFGHVEMRKDSLFPYALNTYRILNEKIKSYDTEGIKEMFDLDYMSKFMALASIFNDVHFMTGDNLKFIYDFDRGRFYPIFRMEFGGILKPSNNFGHFNSLLFESRGESYMNSLSTTVFKILLADNDFRDKRDRYLKKLINDEKVILDELEEVYHVNADVDLCKSDKGSSKYRKKIAEQKQLVKHSLNLAKRYINYTHIYGSYDDHKKKLYLQVDAFSPVNIYYKDSLVLKTRGVEFNNDLNFIHRYDTIDMLGNNFLSKHLIFLNSLTKDTVKQHVYINRINSRIKHSFPL